ADLHLGSAGALPFADGTFDKLFSINAVQFWDDLAAGVAEVRRVLCPGGLAALAIQPRHRGADSAAARAWGERLARELAAAGFEGVRVERLDPRPAPTVCALATVPAGSRPRSASRRTPGAAPPG